MGGNGSRATPGIVESSRPSWNRSSRVRPKLRSLQRSCRAGIGAADVIDRTSHRETGSLRLAALDVGSNSIRLIVAEAQSDGSYRLLDDEKQVTRLGSGLAKTGKLANR